MMDFSSEKIDHSRRRLVGSAAAVAAAIPLGIIGSVEARPQETKYASSSSADKPAGATVVLVHGAWADGSGWARVITPLQSKGLKAVAAPIPLTSLSDDIAALEWTLERTEGPVVLVAHAYSGAVVGACRNERVQALVFITSLTPDAGETVAEVFFREKSQAPHLTPDGHNLLWNTARTISRFLVSERITQRGCAVSCNAAADCRYVHSGESTGATLED
jgi:pimeloyl-ACP methyl ester carboxylesterase